MIKIISLFLSALAILAVGIYLGMQLADNESASGQDSGATSDSERTPLYWVAPMDDSYRRDEPGLSPMGMALIPVYEEAGMAEGTVRVSELVQQNLGLRTAVVRRDDLAAELSAVGYTRWNQTTIETLNTRATGWLEVFNLSSVGDPVARGEVIYELYSPDLQSAQSEFLSAIRSDNSRLADLSEDRLRALGFSNAQIEELRQSGEPRSRLVYRAARDAIVTEIGVRSGSYVTPGTTIATLVSLDTIWVDAEVFASDAGLVDAGTAAEISFPSFPGRRWSGRVEYVYPEIDPVTRSLKVRLAVNNEEGLLKANMFAHVTLHAAPREDVLLIPSEAVIRSQDGQRVILRGLDDSFMVRVIEIGRESGGQVEVISGLEAGEVVVTSGQFLLDSEANGAQAFARLEQAQREAETDSPATAGDMMMEMPQ